MKIRPKHVSALQDAICVFILLLFTLSVAPFYTASFVEDSSPIESGELDLAGWDPRQVIELKGNWKFYWRTFVRDLDDAEASDLYVPGYWSDADPPFPRQSYATYRLAIRNLKPGHYEFHIPSVYAASKVWLDGEVVSSFGEIGQRDEDTRTVWLDHSAHFYSDGSEHEFLVEISAFHHRSNGLEVAPVLGETRAVSKYKLHYISKDIVFQAATVILAIYGFTIFLFRRQDKSALFFGLFTSSAGISMLATGVNMIEFMFPGIPFWLFLLILYVPFALAFACLGLYASTLYPNESVRVLNYLFAINFCAIAICHTALILTGDTLTSSFLIPWLSISAIPLVLYILSIMVRAVIVGREGAIVLLAGTIIFCLLLINDFLVESNVLHRDQTALYGLGEVGFVVFLVAQVMVLAGRWSRTLSRSERLANDLGQLVAMSSSIISDEQLPVLLTRIVASGRRFLGAERGSLFLYDKDTDELVSYIAEGLVNREIRFKAGTGLAGSCFQHGRPINVTNAYQDERFLSAIDGQTGFVSKSILTVPVNTKSGKRIGVMQVLNKIDADQFDESDIEKLVAFASQAAISLENAELFGAVNEARKYSDGILTSMSNGVITIGKEHQIEKVNRATVEIWGFAEEDYLGSDVADILGEENKWLLEELRDSNEDSEPRNFVDVDVQTISGVKKALNISIVPLADDENDLGQLLVLEDITQEKRLKGTMSRFMTKEIADKILESGEDSLSGAKVTASILFADLRGFTSLTENLGAQETVSMLNEYFGYMTDSVFGSRGVLDKFIGDSVMAVFGAPTKGEQYTDNAISCSIDMMESLVLLNRIRAERSEEPLGVSIGIATGEVVAGTIGSSKRMEYTVVGDSVNLASRLEGVTRVYGVDIVVSDETLTGLKSRYMHRELDLIRVKGREAPVSIFELLDHKSSGNMELWERVVDTFSDGLASYRRGEWRRAIDAFQYALKLQPCDGPSKLFLERSIFFESNSPGDSWDGVWTMQEK